MNFLRFLKKFIKGLTSNPDAAKVDEDSSTKIIMETQTEINPVNYVREWAIEKIEMLHDADRHKNAKALLAEFDEWINIPEGETELTYLCLEDDTWGDQEIEVQ
jgi:hypothetical protein